MWDPFLLLLGNKYFLVLYHCTNHFLGGVECCPLLLDKEVSAAPRQKSQLIIYSCRVANLLMDHFGLKTKLKDKDKSAKISRLVIDAHISLPAVRCLSPEGSIGKYLLRKLS